MSPTLLMQVMASVEIPGKPPRWGNESTNFYQGSYMRRPGSASPLKSYRCHGSYYTNSGSCHVGTKVFNQRQEFDTYGTVSAYKLRMEDQRMPRPLVSPEVHNRRLFETSKVNLYQSHQNHYSQFTMGTKQRPHSAGPIMLTKPDVPPSSVPMSQAVPSGTPIPVSSSVPITQPVGPISNKSHGPNLYDSLSKSFYITSYQSQMSQPANKSLNRSTSNPNSLTSVMVRSSSVPVRPLSASSRPQSYSSRSDFLKEVASKYPSPSPQSFSQRTQRPSSAVLLRCGSIPKLRI